MKQPLLALHYRLLWLTALWATGHAQAAESATTPALTLSQDGAYVIDERARLMWSRCVEGMQWNGKTCTGAAQRLDHSQAVALANARWKAEGVRWRLPRTLELKRLVNKADHPPGPDPLLFPGAPQGWLWSGTSNVQQGERNQYNYGTVMESRAGAGTDNNMAFRQGWAVNMQTGESRGDVGKGTRLPVRLVRPYEPEEQPVESGR